MFCFLDMDGVLVDFNKGICELLSEPLEKAVSWNWWVEKHGNDRVWKMLGYEFWAGLQPTAECFDIVSEAISRFGKENVCILSSPCNTAGCNDGKKAWIRQWLPAIRKQVLLGSVKYFCAGPGNVLVDDKEDNINKFYRRGGNGILWPQPWNANGDLLTEGVDRMNFLVKSLDSLMLESLK